MIIENIIFSNFPQVPQIAVVRLLRSSVDLSNRLGQPSQLAVMESKFNIYHRMDPKLLFATMLYFGKY